MRRPRLFKIVFSLLLSVWVISASGQEALSFYSLEEALSRINPLFQASDLQVQGQKARLGHLRRSFVPELTLSVGQEEFGSDRLGRHSSFYYWAEGEMNLFNGFRDYWEEQAREANVRKENLSAILEKRRVLAAVRSAYVQVASGLKHRAILETSLESLRAAAAKASRKIKAGVIAPSDAVALGLIAKSYEDEIFAVNQGLLEPLSVLRVHLNLPDLNADAVQVEILEQGLAKDLEGGVERDLLLSKLEQEKAEVLIRQAESESRKKWPSISLFAGYGRPPYTRREIEVPGERQEWRAGVQATLKLGDILENESEAESLRAQSRAKKIMAGFYKDAGQIKVSDLESSMQRLRSRVKEMSARTQTSGRYYAMVLDEYLRGVKGTSDLSSALNQLHEANSKNLELQKELRLLEIELLSLISGG